MSFILTKRIGGKARNYLYESFRDPVTKRPRRRLLAYLGEHRTIEDRLAHLRERLHRLRQQRSIARRSERNWKSIAEEMAAEFGPSEHDVLGSLRAWLHAFFQARSGTRPARMGRHYKAKAERLEKRIAQAESRINRLEALL